MVMPWNSHSCSGSYSGWGFHSGVAMLREDDTLDVPSYEVVEGVEVIIFIYIEIVYWHLKTIKYTFFNVYWNEHHTIQVTGQSLEHGKSHPLFYLVFTYAFLSVC